MEQNWKPINKPMYIQQLIFDKATKNNQCRNHSIFNKWCLENWIFTYWSWNSNTLATWCEELTHVKRPWCWERLRAGVLASPTQWTWVSVGSRSWWWTGSPWSAAVHGVAKSWTWLSDWTELNWTEPRPCPNPQQKYWERIQPASAYKN